MVRALLIELKAGRKRMVAFAIMFLFMFITVSASDPFIFNNDKLVKVTKFYPNPASSVINFEFAADVDKTYSLQIYNFTGKKSYETPVNADKIRVDLSTFYRGLYFFQLRDRTGRIVESGKFQVIR